MRLHPRFHVVRQARTELSSFMIEMYKKHNLTFLETISILNEEIEVAVKYGIRVERHGDTDKKGDEE